MVYILPKLPLRYPIALYIIGICHWKSSMIYPNDTPYIIVISHWEKSFCDVVDDFVITGNKASIHAFKSEVSKEWEMTDEEVFVVHNIHMNALKGETPALRRDLLHETAKDIGINM